MSPEYEVVPGQLSQDLDLKELLALQVLNKKIALKCQ